MELTPNQMVDALRKCGGTTVCDGCPYQGHGITVCARRLLQDAAAMIEGQKAVIDSQAGRIEACLKLIRGEK